MDSRHDQGLLKARAEPAPGWPVLWLPILLIAFDGSPDLAAAMIHLAALLLLGIVAWGMGRGPAGVVAERLFAALLLVAWFAVCGTAFRLHAVPDSVAARLAVTAGLLLGPTLMLWAWRHRARMVPVTDAAGVVAEPGSVAAAVRKVLMVVAALILLDRLLGLQGADLLVIGTGLALYTTFRVQGRHHGFGLLG